jgi:membrane associated rhomboid family serine protease
MFGLFMFGRVVETIMGSKRFLFYYIVAGLGAGLIQQLAWTIGDTAGLSVGASGAIFALLMAFGFYFPNEPLYFIFFPVPIKAKYMIPIMVVMELLFGVANFQFDNIAHYAHLGGLLVGLAMLLYWRKNPLNRFRQ